MALIDAPGAAVAVVQNGELVYEAGYGVKLRGGNDLIDRHTIFRIGPITKQMTAAAVMQQVELGRVALSDPVTELIPEFEIAGRWPADQITVWNALTHTSGFPDWVDSDPVRSNAALSLWAGRQLEVPLHAPPGSFWNYASPNYMIAGLIAERAAGTPYRQLFKENLWQPAGMDSTTFSPDEVIGSGNYAYGHCYTCAIGGERIVVPEEHDLWAVGPAGMAFSTAGDLANWALLLMNGGGSVLSPSSASIMQERHQWMHLTPDQYYGLGIMTENYRGLDVRAHGGVITGFGAHLLWVSEYGFAVAVLVNVTSTLDDLAHCIIDEVLGPDPVEPPDLHTDPSTWARYEGDYLFRGIDSTQGAQVFLDGEELFITLEDPVQAGVSYTTELVQQFSDTFWFDSNEDGSPETEITFCSSDGEPGFVRWLRNRRAVAERQFSPRSAGRRVTP